MRGCLLEDVLPRAALLFDPPDLGVEGRRMQLTMVGSRGRSTIFYQSAAIAAAIIRLARWCSRRAICSDCTAVTAWPPSRISCWFFRRSSPLAGYDIASRRPIGEIRIQHRLYEDPTRIAGVRRYEAGDPLNRVHWRATARTGQLHSKVYESSTMAGRDDPARFSSSGPQPERRAVSIGAWR